VAQQKKVLLIDDIDGRSEAAETVTFGLDGALYEIDLTADNAQALREELDAYVTAGRRAPGAARPRRTPAAVEAPEPAPEVNIPPAAVRQWALEQGIEVGGRGRLSQGVIEQYQTEQARAVLTMATRGRRRRAAR
jgi:hypothetical protein